MGAAWRPGARAPTRAVEAGRSVGGPRRANSDPPRHTPASVSLLTWNQTFLSRQPGRLGAPRWGRRVGRGCPHHWRRPCTTFSSRPPVHPGGANHSVFSKRLGVALYPLTPGDPRPPALATLDPAGHTAQAPLQLPEASGHHCDPISPRSAGGEEPAAPRLSPWPGPWCGRPLAP